MSQDIAILTARDANGIGDLNSRQVQIVSVTSILIFLSTLAVALRFISRRISTRYMCVDDYVIFFALLLSYGDCICQFVGIYYGLGQHIGEVGKENEATYFIILYILQLFWNTTLPAIKISILLFYRRLFPVRGLRVGSLIIGAIVFAWYIAIQITAICQCLPIQYYWQRVGQGRCIQATEFYITLASLNLATDVAVLVLPIPSIWHLQIRRSKKLSLSAIFLLGLTVCITSVIRLQTLTDIDTHDITWSNAYPGLWTAIEASLGIAAACLPSLGPVLHKFTGRPRSTSNETPAQSQHKPASKPPDETADMEDFERMLGFGLEGRGYAVIMNAIVGHPLASFEPWGMGTSEEMGTWRKDGNEAQRLGGIVVRKDIEQDVEQRVL